eukprot:TRINITY_DN115200_c0_g1_i1.p1 TRINITY_DN115200_c0_g1~~TRINITY_DN115200_c0_g1_i1.p1  ORF type:complete len:251 (-),score=42.48 TRINITY_DN115200_c0_g1_i1:147-899(-)
MDTSKSAELEYSSAPTELSLAFSYLIISQRLTHTAMSRRASLLSRVSSMSPEERANVAVAEELSIDFLTGDISHMKDCNGVVLLGCSKHGRSSKDCMEEILKRTALSSVDLSEADLGIMFYEGDSETHDKPAFGSPFALEDDVTRGKQSGLDEDAFLNEQRCTVSNPRWADKIAEALRDLPATEQKIHVLFCGADHLRANLPGESCEPLQAELTKRGVDSAPYIIHGDEDEFFKEADGGAVVLFHFANER